MSAEESSHRSTVLKERASKSLTTSKSARSLVTIKVFCARIFKKFSPVELPDFDNVTGKEWDTRAKAFLKQQIKCMFTCKEVALIKSDLRMWPENDIHEVTSLICELLSVQNYLVDFAIVYGVVIVLLLRAKNNRNCSFCDKSMKFPRITKFYKVNIF